MDAIDFHDPDWVEKAWMREDTSGFRQHAVRGRRDGDESESFEVDRPDKLCDPAGSALGTLPEEGGIEAVPGKRWNLEFTLSLGFASKETNKSRFIHLPRTSKVSPVRSLRYTSI